MPEQKKYDFDVFISYSRRDDAWVHNWLLPRLDNAGLEVCIDIRNFKPGSPVPATIEFAISHSRHTLAVLTPDWINSAWTDLESQLTFYSDPAARHHRFIPLMLKPCMDHLPLRVKNIVCADFTDPGQHEEQFKLLLELLKASLLGITTPPPRAPELSHTQSARAGLQALILFMQMPVVRAAVSAFQSDFQAACQQIQSLGNDKALHDFFQKLELGYNLIFQNGKRAQTDTSAWDDLERDEFNLESIIDEWFSSSDHRTADTETPMWVQKLQRARQELYDAIRLEDHRQLKSAIRRVDEVLSREPSRTNARLVATASALRLGALAQALTTVRARLATSSPGRAPSGKFTEVEVGVDALIKLENGLKLSISHHDALQQIDDELRRVETLLNQNVDEINEAWEYSRPKVGLLPADGTASWAVKLRETGVELDGVLKETDPVKVRRAFRRFRSQANRSFNQVDRDLLTLCEELQTVGEPLAYVLRLIQGDDANE